MARRAMIWPAGPMTISSELVIEYCPVILLKAPNQAEGLVRRFRGSQEVPGVTVQNLWIILTISIYFGNFCRQFRLFSTFLVEILLLSFFGHFLTTFSP